jgi:FkbM family methyltransferase
MREPFEVSYLRDDPGLGISGLDVNVRNLAIRHHRPFRMCRMIMRRCLTRIRMPVSRALDKLIGYIRCFGWARGFVFFMLGLVWPRSRGRKVAVRLPDAPGPLFVRLDTTDILVFNEIFRGGEYDWDFDSPPACVVDAGAYTGLSTAFFAHRYPQAKIIAIEPNPENFEMLLLNTSGAGNVSAVRAVFWIEGGGSVRLTDPGNGAWAYRLAPADESPAPEKTVASVPAVTVSDILRDYGLERIGLLKLDVEGSEKELFEHSAPWISKVDGICLELHDRFKPGCSRAFFKAVDDFPLELRRGEEVLVLREGMYFTGTLAAAGR